MPPMATYGRSETAPGSWLRSTGGAEDDVVPCLGAGRAAGTAGGSQRRHAAAPGAGRRLGRVPRSNCPPKPPASGLESVRVPLLAPAAGWSPCILRGSAPRRVQHQRPGQYPGKSAGKEIGDFGHIFVNGVNVSPEGVGYNIVPPSPETGAIVDRRAFNTFASADASRSSRPGSPPFRRAPLPP